MKSNETNITCCPKCKRIVRASDYTTTLVGSILPKIRCRCGYRGLPIEIRWSDYKKWLLSD